MALDFHQLRAFLVVAEAGTLGRACARLNVTQPALSRLMRRMEMQMGVELFERRSKGMELTSYGQALLPHAQSLVAEAGLAEEEIAALRGLSRGTVRVGALASAAATILPQAVSRLLYRWPGLRVTVLEGMTDMLAAALANRTIDLAIATEFPADETIARATATGSGEAYAVVAAWDHPIGHQLRVSMHDVLCESWVLPPRDAPPRQLFERRLMELGMPLPQVSVETRAPGVARAMVAQTRYLSWLPADLVADDIEKGLIRAIEVKPLSWSADYFVYRRRGGTLSIAARKLLDEFRRPLEIAAAA